jgi:FAD/FMN-containing dehydrogenase
MMAATAKPPRNVTARPAEFVRTEVDSRRLAGELASNLRGEVRFDAGSRALYAKDYSVYRHVPIGVVIPQDVDDVVATVEVCRRYGAPILAAAAAPAPTGSAATWPW